MIPEGIEIQSRINRGIHGIRIFVRVLFDTAPFDVLELHYKIKLFSVNPTFIIDISGRIGKSNSLAPQIHKFFHGILGYVPGTGNQAGLAFQCLMPGGEHFCGKVDGAIAGGLGTDETASPF